MTWQWLKVVQGSILGDVNHLVCVAVVVYLPKSQQTLVWYLKIINQTTEANWIFNFNSLKKIFSLKFVWKLNLIPSLSDYEHSEKKKKRKKPKLKNQINDKISKKKIVKTSELACGLSVIRIRRHVEYSNDDFSD